MIVIPINGVGGSGKDSVIQMVREIIEPSGWIVYNRSLVDVPKKVAQKLGWTGEKTEGARQFLSDLKDAWQKYNDGPFEWAKRQIMGAYAFKGGEKTVMFVHMREKADIRRLSAWVVGSSDAIVIPTYVYRSVLVPGNNGDRDAAIPDPDLYKATIVNLNGLEELRKSVEWFVKTHIGD